MTTTIRHTVTILERETDWLLTDDLGWSYVATAAAAAARVLKARAASLAYGGDRVVTTAVWHPITRCGLLAARAVAAHPDTLQTCPRCREWPEGWPRKCPGCGRQS